MLFGRYRIRTLMSAVAVVAIVLALGVPFVYMDEEERSAWTSIYGFLSFLTAFALVVACLLVRGIVKLSRMVSAVQIRPTKKR
jgi:heme/copper-type cytochrome/quinol oxidase subunit 4